MTVARLVGGLVALVMVLSGGFLALAGMGYIGDSARTSTPWVLVGSLLAGLGLGLAITLVQRRR